MKTIYEITDILSGKNESSITIFCGAGISVKSGLPTASELLEYILKRLDIEDEDISELKHDSYKWIMPFESFMDAFIEHDQNTKLFKIFLLGKPNHNHYLIRKLANKSSLNKVFTTNFDLLIERMFETEPSLKFKVFLETDTDEYFSADSDCIPLIKLHGSADINESIKSTILSITSGDSFENRKKLIRSAFNSCSDILWVWGYSCSDVLDITPTIQSIQNNNKTVILLHHNPNLNDIEKAVIVPLKKSDTKNPFSKFDGYIIHINSDTLVQNILENESPFKEEPINSSQWKKIVDEWVDSFTFVHIKYSILCHLFYNVAKYDLALKYNSKSIKQNSGIDKRGDGAALSNRGLILYQIGKKKEALKSFYEALDIFNEINYSFGVATSYNSIGNVLGQLGKIEDGFDLLQTGLDYIENNSFKEDLMCKGYFAKSKGELCVKKGDFQGAEENFNLALEIFKKGYKMEEAEVLMIKGEFYRMTGRIEESNELLNDAITLANKVGCSEWVAKCKKILNSEIN